MKKSRFNTARKILIFWTLFIGIGAVAGASGMLLDPSGKAMGMDAMLPYFQKLPFAEILFNDLTFSGYALLIVNGITNLIASVFLFMKKKTGAVLGFTFGITLMLWICIQFYMFPLNFMSTIYFIFGFFQAITGFTAIIFYKQEHFEICESSFKNIGTHKDKLVIYFSRMGYAKRIALKEADKIGAEVLEIKTVEKSSGTSGFWWCGRYGMHKLDMKTKDTNINLLNYQEITIVSPIWVFNLSAPIRYFLKENKGKINKANLILIHHTKSKYTNALNEVESILNIKINSFRSYQNKCGKIKEIK